MISRDDLPETPDWQPCPRPPYDPEDIYHRLMAARECPPNVILGEN